MTTPHWKIDQKIETQRSFLSSEANEVIAVPSATHRKAAESPHQEPFELLSDKLFLGERKPERVENVPPNMTNPVFPVWLKHHREAAYAVYLCHGCK
jgi:hypothetical protein